jgi:hypothetical protein
MIGPNEEPNRERQARLARRAIGGIIARGIENYDRARHLPLLIPVGPDEIADQGIEARRKIAARLARALRAERTRGRAGHWTYDLNRHIGLRQAYEAERLRLKAAPRDAGRSTKEQGRRGLPRRP